MRLIAETAFHHEGDFSFQEKLVRAITDKSRADIVKLHLLLDIDEYMLAGHPLFPKVKDWIFDKQQWSDVIGIVADSSKDLMLLYNDTAAVEFGALHEPSLVEIHSVCLNDVYLLECLREHINKETRIVLGVGGSSLYEIENAINLLKNPNIVMMFGFQNFPTEYQNINMSKMRRVMKLFPEFHFGYADHTAWNEPNNVFVTLMGAALGMEYVEKHVTTAYGHERIDWSAAVSIDMFNEIREKMDLLEHCNGDGLLRLNSAEQAYSVFGPMKKAAVAGRDLLVGEKLEREALVFRRTAQISDLSQVDAMAAIGVPLAELVHTGEVLLRRHLNKIEGR